MSQINAITQVYDENEQLQDGVEIFMKMILPPNELGVYSDIVRVFTSTGGGLIDTIPVWQGATYQLWRGNSNRIRHRIPDDAEDDYELPPIIGNEETDDCISAQ